MKVRRGESVVAKRGNFECRVGEPDPSKSGSQPESRTIMYCFVCVVLKYVESDEKVYSKKIQ